MAAPAFDGLRTIVRHSMHVHDMMHAPRLCAGSSLAGFWALIMVDQSSLTSSAMKVEAPILNVASGSNVGRYVGRARPTMR